MRCYKCGKESSLKRGLCINCYKEILHNKYKKRKNNPSKINYILNNLDRKEKILEKAESSSLMYLYITILFGISLILFPRTIFEFFINNNKTYFLILIFNILLFFFAIYLAFYFTSRDIFLTDKKIIGKWGLFKIKTINIPLNNLISIDTYQFKGLEIDNKEKNYFFDFVGNNETFKLATIFQIKKLINSTNSENVLMSFSHSLNEQINNYNLNELNPNMIYCKCCNKLISKKSINCIHCGQPVIENQRTADLFTKILCLICPPIGIILFLLNIAPYPKFAKQCFICSIFSLFIILFVYLSIYSINIK